MSKGTTIQSTPACGDNACARIPSDTFNLIVAPLLLAGLVLAAYWNCYDAPFIFDTRYVFYRAYLPQSTLWEVLTFSSRPLSMLALIANFWLSEEILWQHHAVNVAIHLFATLTLFGLVRRTFESIKNSYDHPGCELPMFPSIAKKSGELAFVLAALWAVHPLQTESVTYIYQRSESMAGLFILLTLYALARTSSEKHKCLWSAACIASCALAMPSKEIAIVTPVLALLYDRTFISGSFKNSLTKRLPLFIGLALTWGVLGLSMYWGHKFHTQSGAGFTTNALTPWEYARTQPEVILHYLKLVVWPVQLLLDYRWPAENSYAVIVATGLPLLAMLAMTVYLLIKNHALSFPATAFFIVLSPTSSFIPLNDPAFEHRMYLPLACVLVFIIIAAYKMIAILSERYAMNLIGLIATGLVASICGTLAITTMSRNEDYRSNIRMWGQVTQLAPHNDRAYVNLGYSLIRDRRCVEALGALRTGYEINHKEARTLYGIGLVMEIMYRNAEAKQYYLKAIKTRWNYGKPYFRLAGLLCKEGKLEESCNYYLKALEFEPKHAANWAGAGEAAFLMGDNTKALEYLERSIKLDSEKAATYYNIGMLQARLKKHDSAMTSFNKALKLQPDDPEILFERASVYFETGKYEKAIADFKEVVRLNPQRTSAYHNIAATYERMGNIPAALENYRRVLKEKDIPDGLRELAQKSIERISR